jgi:membrane-associated protease RseP (regulator of RpoE activity)
MEERRVPTGIRAVLALVLAAGVSLAPWPGAAQQAQQARGIVRVVRPQGWIGLTVDFDLQTAWQSGTRMPTPAVVISEVFDGGPADRAGLQPGDTILRINQRPATEDAILRLQSTLEPGDRVSFQLRRGGRIRSVPVQAGSRPADDELATLPPQIRVQVESAQAALLQQLDSAARFGMLAAGEGRTLFLLRTPDDSLVVSFPASGTPDPLQRGDAFDRTWTVAVRPSPAPFEGVVARVRSAQTGPVRPAAEATARQADLELVRAGVEEAARALAEIQAHRRPLAPYILGDDMIAGAKLAPLNPDLAEYFGVRRGLLVVSVVDDTPAADAGVLSGDVIVSSAQRSFRTVEELRAVFASGRSDAVPLTLIRKGRRLQVSVPR